MKVKICELCNGEAAVYCPSDAAFLCWSCDAQVHQANFLVARHLRHSVCSNCKNFTGHGISGVGFHPRTETCNSCPPTSSVDDLDSSSSSSSSCSSVCISSTSSPANENSGEKRRRGSRSPVDHFKAEGIFVKWCGELGAEVDGAVRMACKALKVCLDRWTILPYRVCLAASMWVGLRLSLEKPAMTRKVLKRLEEISGVPAKIILAAESKLEPALRGGRPRQQDHRRRRLELQEGWAEC